MEFNLQDEIKDANLKLDITYKQLDRVIGQIENLQLDVKNIKDNMQVIESRLSKTWLEICKVKSECVNKHE